MSAVLKSQVFLISASIWLAGCEQPVVEYSKPSKAVVDEEMAAILAAHAANNPEDLTTLYGTESQAKGVAEHFVRGFCMDYDEILVELSEGTPSYIPKSAEEIKTNAVLWSFTAKVVALEKKSIQKMINFELKVYRFPVGSNTWQLNELYEDGKMEWDGTELYTYDPTTGRPSFGSSDFAPRP